MKKIFFLFFMMLPFCQAVVAKQAIDVKIISYNIRTLARDGSNSWQYRNHATATMLHKHKPDAFGLQEAMVPHLLYIDSV
ncbi:MAG: endonuclease, partial [Bacteroidaceae bacterium]|nr:endonuclease [Bacteroidaceae bacterium]